jgi:hypothetical protein
VGDFCALVDLHRLLEKIFVYRIGKMEEAIEFSLSKTVLELGYEEMSKDEQYEKGALEWIEAVVENATDEL